MVAIKLCEVCWTLIEIQERARINRTRFCSKPCFFKGRTLKGTYQPGHAKSFLGPRVHSPETRRKISETQRLNPRRGSENQNWRGGKTNERSQAMGRWEYKEWRTAVFKRDSYTCQGCGITGKYLHADHIERWVDSESLRFDVTNGRTLCYECHYTRTFGRLDPEAAYLWGVPAKYRGGGTNFK